MLLQCDPFEFFLGLHDLGVGAFLETIKACHCDNHGKENSERDHEAKEYFIVEVVRCKRRLDRHFVGYVVVYSVRDRLGYLLEPAGVIEDDEDVVVHLVLGEEDRVGGAPLADLLLIHVRSCLNKFASDLLLVLDPGRLGHNVAIIVALLFVEEENVELVRGLQAIFRFYVDTLDADFVLRLRDICFQVVVLETLASQSELSESVRRDL